MNENLIGQIDLAHEKIRFQSHIVANKNSRILFSGIFGIGKTTFLRNFFQDNKNYEYIHLFPVNYQISNTEQIIDYIKYDLLINVLSSQEIDFRNLKGWKSALAVALGKEGLKEVVKIAEDLPYVGDAVTLGKNIGKLYSQVKENKKDDFIDKFIEERVKSQKDKKKSVLVIDDLDRIDPEHLFRLLNIFTAHQDVSDQENMFGFDKVIFVFDYNNVANIFKAKYGTNVDFNGYIDKFYSEEVFVYKNRVSLRQELYNYLYKRYSSNEDLASYLFLFFSNLIYIDKFSVRNLIKLSKIHLSIQEVDNFLEYAKNLSKRLYETNEIENKFEDLFSIKDTHDLKGFIRPYRKWIKLAILSINQKENKDFIYLPDKSITNELIKEGRISNTSAKDRVNFYGELWELLIK